jgi:hypothetical protein
MPLFKPMRSNFKDKQPRITSVDSAALLSRAADQQLRILLLADDAHPADAVIDHIQAIQRQSRHDVTVVNPITYRYGFLLRALHFDVVIIHYSICVLYDYYLPAPIAAALKEFQGPKIQIIQDEYRWIDRMTRQMSELGVGAVFSSLSVENIRRVYHHEHLAGVRFVSGLPGYVSSRLHRVVPKPLVARVYDLVYRGRPVPIWLGKFGQEKAQIGLHAQAMAKKYDLNVNCATSEKDRVYGLQWNELLMMGRAALATQGGATVFDFDQSVERNVEGFRYENPNASDDEVWDAVVKPIEGRIVHKTITPRVLEAVMCRTALVMYPGEYRGLLRPWEHYIPLERNGSNEAEVVDMLRDDGRLEELVERAYRRVADDPALQFSRYVGAVDGIACALYEETRARHVEVGSVRSYINRAPVRLILKAGERWVIKFNELCTWYRSFRVAWSPTSLARFYIKPILGPVVRRLVKR